MELQAPPVQRHDVEILTVDFQFSGQIETVGPVANFINDTTRDDLSLYDVQLAALTPGSPLTTISRPHVVVRKPQIVFLYFTSAETRASIRTLVRRELLVAYTPTAVCRGHFHMSAEANVRDFLGVTPGDLLPVTEARIFPLTKLPAPFPAEADLVMLGRAHLHFYHTA
jgi:hypothetical protein